jgi:peroxiredoxin
LLKLAVLGCGLVAAAVVGGCDRQSDKAAQPAASAPAGSVSAGIDRSQNGSTLPDLTLTDPAGGKLPLASLKGKPVLLNLWATWCAPCKAELNAIAENFTEWQKETGVKIYAVSIDDARNMEKVKPYVQGKNWEYEVLLDPNGDFKRAMNVNNVPHLFILDKNKIIVYQQNSAAPGDDEKLFELVKKIANNEPIK